MADLSFVLFLRDLHRLVNLLRSGVDNDISQRRAQELILTQNYGLIVGLPVAIFFRGTATHYEYIEANT